MGRLAFESRLSSPPRSALATEWMLLDFLGSPTSGRSWKTLPSGLWAGAEPSPIPVTAKQLFAADYDSELVSIEAVLLEESLVAGTQALILRDGGLTFNAAMAADEPDGKLHRYLQAAVCR